MQLEIKVVSKDTAKCDSNCRQVKKAQWKSGSFAVQIEIAGIKIEGSERKHLIA